jgi:hypothetical protein
VTLREEDEVLLQAYLDGELDAAESERVRLRIANSPQWQEAERTLGALLADCSHAFAAVDDDDAMLRPAPAMPAAAPAARPVRWLRAASIAVVLVGGTSLALLVRNQGLERGGDVAAAGRADDAVRDSGAVKVATQDSVRVVPSVDSGIAPPGRPPRVAPAPILANAPASVMPAADIEGLRRIALRVDTTLDVRVERQEYELRPGVTVALELTDAAEEGGLRGGDAAPITGDSSVVVRQVAGGRSVSWRDAATGRMVRLRAPISERELLALRERVRLTP